MAWTLDEGPGASRARRARGRVPRIRIGRTPHALDRRDARDERRHRQIREAIGPHAIRDAIEPPRQRDRLEAFATQAIEVGRIDRQVGVIDERRNVGAQPARARARRERGLGAGEPRVEIGGAALALVHEAHPHRDRRGVGIGRQAREPGIELGEDGAGRVGRACRSRREECEERQRHGGEPRAGGPPRRRRAMSMHDAHATRTFSRCAVSAARSRGPEVAPQRIRRRVPRRCAPRAAATLRARRPWGARRDDRAARAMPDRPRASRRPRT